MGFVHPSIFLCNPGDGIVPRLFIDLATNWKQSDERLFRYGNLSISADDLLGERLDFETKEEYAASGKEPKFPIVFLLVDLSDEYSIQGFFDFITRVSVSDSFRDAEGTDYRFVIVISRDYNRKSASKHTQLESEFFNQLEKFYRENRGNVKFSLSYQYLVVLDSFHESEAHRISRVESLFDQLRTIIQSLVYSDNEGLWAINHSNQVVVGGNSSVRYNSFGFATVGFNSTKVQEAISLRYQSLFLDEILSKESIPEETQLELTRYVQLFVEQQFNPVENELKDGYLRKTLSGFLSELLRRLGSENEELSQSLNTVGLRQSTSRFISEFDLALPRFRITLQEAQEHAINAGVQKVEILSDAVSRETKRTLKEVAPCHALLAAEFELRCLQEQEFLHEVTKHEGEVKDSLDRIIQRLSERIDLLKIPDESDFAEDVDQAKQDLHEIDSSLEQSFSQVTTLNQEWEIGFITRNLVNLVLIPLLGLIIGCLSFLIFPDVNLFGWDIINRWGNLLILSLLFPVIAVAIGGYRAYLLKNEIKTLENRIEAMLHQKVVGCRQLLAIYDNHFNLIQEKVLIDVCYRTFVSVNESVNREIERLKSFNESLVSFKKNVDNRFYNVDYSDGYFNKNVVGRKEVEYFCNNVESTFFEGNRNLSHYYTDYLSGRGFFDELLFPDYSSDVQLNEIIHANSETYDPDIHVYESIEKQEPSLFLVDKEVAPTDVKQGSLGDCYFLAGLASIAAAEPQIIKRIVKSEAEYNTSTFYDENGKVHEVSVDSKFWVNVGSSQPVYAKFSAQEKGSCEIWPMVIEKAWAKINGSDYTNINGDNREGNIRRIDYSLALTGHPAIRETLSKDEGVSQETISRIRAHLYSKPIVLYSVSEKDVESNKDLIENHAYSLIKVSGDLCQIYNPHGSFVEITITELHHNFDTILYFDFNFSEDKHLSGLYSNFFTRDVENSLVQDFQTVIDNLLDSNVRSVSFEDLFATNVFGLSMDRNDLETLARHIINASTPFVYLVDSNTDDYQVYIVGNNTRMQSIIESIIGSGSFDDLPQIQTSEKRMGLIKLRNNLKLHNLIGS